MRVDLIQNENWDLLNLDLGQILECKNVRAYNGLSHGIFELAMSWIQQMSHKKAVGIVSGSTPYFKDIKQILYQETFAVQDLDCNELHNSKAWVEGLKKETNFVLYSSDHPITGERYSWEILDQALNEKKVFSVRISHFDWLKEWDGKIITKKPNPYSIHLFSISSDFSIAILGDKVKSQTLFARNMFWNREDKKEKLKSTVANFVENKNLVLEFESNLPPGWKSYFSTGAHAENRVYDRAVIYNENVHSEAIWHELCDKLSVPKKSPSERIEIETTNLCRWGGVSLYDSWWTKRPHNNILRGMLLISLESLSKYNSDHSNQSKMKSFLQEAENHVRL